MKTSKFNVGDVVKQTTKDWTRTILQIRENYLDTKGRFGYFYRDDFGYGMCSEDHLRAWIKR